MHGLLHFGIKVLHPKTQAVKAQFSQESQTLGVDRARIHFDGVFTPRRQREAALEHGHQLPQTGIREKGRRTAPQVQLTHHLPHATVRRSISRLR